MEATRERLLDEKDFMEQIFQGFVLNSTVSTGIPLPNAFTEQIIEHLLNTNLDIKNYTNHYNEFLFSAMAILSKYGNIRENEVRVISDEDGNMLKIRQNLDVERFQKADRQEAIKMIAELLLECVEIYLFDRDDFDGKKFHEDLKPLLLPIINGTRTFQDSDFVL